MGSARLFEAYVAITCERAFLLAHFFARGGIGVSAQQRLVVGDQRAAETEIGRALLRQQRERIGGAAPSQRLVGELEHVDTVAKVGEYPAQSVGLNAGGNVASPQAHVEIGVLAAEEFHHP